MEVELNLCSDGQKDGIWAWDCVYNEAVMVIPSVLALLGDNPMQSEFTSHIGLNGNMFCRVCMTHKSLNEESSDEEVIADGANAPRRKRKRAMKKKKKKTPEEQVNDYVDRACRFMTVSHSFYIS